MELLIKSCSGSRPVHERSESIDRFFNTMGNESKLQSMICCVSHRYAHKLLLCYSPEWNTRGGAQQNACVLPIWYAKIKSAKAQGEAEETIVFLFQGSHSIVFLFHFTVSLVWSDVAHGQGADLLFSSKQLRCTCLQDNSLVLIFIYFSPYKRNTFCRSFSIKILCKTSK